MTSRHRQANPHDSFVYYRAVVDEVLPPSFLNDPIVCNLGGEVVEHAKRMLSREHVGAKLESCWGPGDGRPVEELKIAVDQLLQEYLLSSDIEEATRCILELQVLHHPVIGHDFIVVIAEAVIELSTHYYLTYFNSFLRLPIFIMRL